MQCIPNQQSKLSGRGRKHIEDRVPDTSNLCRGGAWVHLAGGHSARPHKRDKESGDGLLVRVCAAHVAKWPAPLATANPKDCVKLG